MTFIRESLGDSLTDLAGAYDDNAKSCFVHISNPLNSEQFLDRFLVDLCADYAELARNVCSACPYVFFTGHVIEMYPLAAFACNDALGTEDLAILV